MAPRPDDRLRWARVAYDSPYGRIESFWRIDGPRFELDILVPAGTSAEVRLPDGTSQIIGPGRASLDCDLAGAGIR